ncbi:hypothetical protein MKW98_020339 [Papaver atlanticum]|uniref:SAM domain-containing protein n=1 Tax=Papaver atlanticum TaxID=357466 RepID=A0AAD4RW75_9MAGN|nr:hypothetical protein MKW98_020339 [Papaver atlanticum]
MDGQGGEAAVVRILEDTSNQMINQLQIISRKLTEFEKKLKELKNGYDSWVAKQCFPVEVAVVTTSYAMGGAAYGVLFGTVGQVASHVFPKHSPAIKGFCSSPMEEARVHAALQATCASVTCIMKRIRGKEDIQTRMAAGFGAGAMFRLMTRMGRPYVAADAVILGVVCALNAGTMHQLDQRHAQPEVEYTRTRRMLSNLGLQNYEKNFEKGLLTDITMPLLTESSLKDVGVPPGPRLLILDHTERDPELQKM